MKDKVKIFYSWQSNLPRDVNQNAIRFGIKKAITSIEEDNEGVHIALDEATRGESGSPDIPSTIFDKIRHCDIFLCDITFVDSRSNEKKVRFSNPNVLIELGYAISVLGWERIILVFNKSYGDFQNNLPFDIDKRRINAFTIKDKNDKSGKGQLKTDLIKQLELIIKNKPPKNNIAFGNIEDVHKKRDYRTLDELLDFVHIESIENFLENLPESFLFDIVFYYEKFATLYYSHKCKIYDKKLDGHVESYIRILGHLVSYKFIYDKSSITHHIRTPNTYVHVKENKLKGREVYRDFEDISKTRTEHHVIFDKLLNYIRDNYFLIDLKTKSKNALENYRDYCITNRKIE
ncbi:MAG: nucleotide-binding protein [Bacteroidales bacterium]|nr:nucleotide-binding protein [Bacteroidales bacterium]MCF8326932.1 nucleotide-binding protein [Bacteroidales bacterium]